MIALLCYIIPIDLRHAARKEGTRPDAKDAIGVGKIELIVDTGVVKMELKVLGSRNNLSFVNYYI